LVGFHFWSAVIVLAARLRPSFGEWPRPKSEGTARQMARQSLICTPSCEGVAPSGAPSGVLLSASGRAFRDRPDDGRPPSASSWRAARIGRQADPDAARVRGLLATPAGAGPFHTSRRNRFASLMGADKNRYMIL